MTSVKNKIWLGTFFLFLLLLLSGGVNIYYTIKIKNDAKAILQDNYETLSYAHTMQALLDSLPLKQDAAIKGFDSVLRLQEQNVTEPGEQEATDNVKMNFERLKQRDTGSTVIGEIKSSIQKIIRLNMNAIHQKNQKAEAAANDALTYIISLAGAIFLIAFTFIINFPSIVTNPISKLTEAIKEISNKNYAYRIHIDNKDEFGKLADSFNEMASRLQYFENSNLNKLLFEKSRAEAVINSLKDASIGLDKNNIILFANRQALQLLSMRNEDIVGKKAAEVAERNDLFKFLLENNAATPFKIVVQNRENYFIREIIEISQEEAQSRVIVVKNITSFKELDEAKTNFIATVSHELKTPLAASDFSLKLLEDQRTGSLSTAQKELIENLKQDNQRMLKILSELLNMSQLEAGKIQLNFTQTNAGDIIDKAVNAVETNAKEKNISIKKIIANDLPAMHADEDKTIWVLNNFLTNAIKYSSENNIVAVSAYRKDSSIIFSVKDHGKGIAKEYQPKLFDRYFKVPGSNEKGTGLGLAISKEFIEAQGGNIWVESELGQGATFFCSLPLQIV
jgi:NtrC-family two-component system sensor histidine kinase KinB